MSSTTRVAVVGNSNSVMRESFAALLGADPRFEVHNHSIGATPNIALLDFVVMAPDLRFDYIIVETAVIDVMQGRPGDYPPSVAKKNLHLFLNILTSISRARVIFVIIPTKIALLEPAWHETESMYLEVCKQFGIPALNLYNIIRDSLGDYSVERVQKISAHAPILAEAFGLPRQLAFDIGWGQLSNRMFASNALGFYAFVDFAHINRAMHALIYDLVSKWMSDLGDPDPRPELNALQHIILRGSPNESSSGEIWRKSSLLSRRLIRFDDGDFAIIDCPPSHLAIGMLINQAKTSAFITLESSAGAVGLDCRLKPYPMEWAAIIIPIFGRIGAGAIKLTVSKDPIPQAIVRHIPGTVEKSEGWAEVGELILVDEAYYDSPLAPPPDYVSRHGGFIQIEYLDWAKGMCALAQKGADRLLGGREFRNVNVFPHSAAYIRGQLTTGDIDGSAAGRARYLLLLGDIDGIKELFGKYSAGDDLDQTIVAMMTALTRYLASIEAVTIVREGAHAVECPSENSPSR